MKLANGAQLLNIAPLFLSPVLFASSSTPSPVIAIVPLTSMYASLHYNHVNLPYHGSFKSNLAVDAMSSIPIYFNSIFCSKFRWLIWCIVDLSFFDIPLLYYYTNLRSPIIFCLFSGDIHRSLRISVSLSIVSEVFYGKFLEAFVILLSILLPIKSPVVSAFFE